MSKGYYYSRKSDRLIFERTFANDGQDKEVAQDRKIFLLCAKIIIISALMGFLMSFMFNNHLNISVESIRYCLYLTCIVAMYTAAILLAMLIFGLMHFIYQKTLKIRRKIRKISKKQTIRIPDWLFQYS
jgi:polyferredoxin